jgi:periplasmic divalent cation tolerance protein
MEQAQATWVVLVTVPSADQGAVLGRVLVEERLAACVNVLSPVRSIYCWQGEIEDASEALLLIKTRAERFERLRTRVLELHPYTCPEILALSAEAGHEGYLQWVAENVGPQRA